MIPSRPTASALLLAVLAALSALSSPLPGSVRLEAGLPERGLEAGSPPSAEADTNEIRELPRPTGASTGDGRISPAAGRYAYEVVRLYPQPEEEASHDAQ